ncbi:ABC transporter ATP-binding protein [Leekyejoonella antrihumi]|uniref:ABC transporter ATP-binding protein n=1 Tax=Leekyejoonella antrihumi TaxID=1660198 RepID=A0A563E2N2_9MICO|nr:ABC transporter ATP-binding protein [Leekyejoonella antrihumi]TWP36798.1 ABC transporter ATP-binding protein [Leekyejoonella antrihumi]
MSKAIWTDGLTKSFGAIRALDALDLSVELGEVHGFLGPNGAGKSTTLRVLLGTVRADAGMARVLDGDPWRDAASLHRRLAYVPGDVDLWPGLSGGEVIDLLGRLRGGLNEARRAELLDRFELDPRKKAGTYSKGNRQKVVLVAALAADVELLLLDEPTSGLDPLMERIFQECVMEAASQGRTVLLSSHIMSEVEQLCDSVSIIRAGRVVETGSLEHLRHLTGSRVMATVQQDVPDSLLAVPGVQGGTVDGRRFSAQVDAAHLGEVLERLTALGVTALTSTPPSLEEIFLSHYHHEPVDGHS